MTRTQRRPGGKPGREDQQSPAELTAAPGRRCDWAAGTRPTRHVAAAGPHAGARREPRPIPTLHEFSSEWYRRRCVLGDLAESTKSNLEWEIGHLVRRLADWSRPREPRSLRLDEITAERVEDMLAAVVAAGLSRGSAGKIGKLLVTLLEVAVEYGHVARNVAAGPVRRFKAGKPRQTALDSAAGIAALLDSRPSATRRRDPAARPASLTRS